MRGASRALASLGRRQRLAVAVVAACSAAALAARASGAPVWLQAAVGTTGLLAAVVALGLAVAHTRAERVEEWSSLLARPIARVAELLSADGIYALGVDTEAPNAVAAFPSAGVHAPYVE